MSISTHTIHRRIHAPVQSAVGGGDVSALHALGYVHPATAVTAACVSPASNHPFPTLTVGVPLDAATFPLGLGVTYMSVGALAVAVYVASSVSAAASTFAIDAGGQAPTCARAPGAIVPAPTPPVCQALNIPSNAGPEMPSEAHLPTDARGSAGIQPPSRPSW